MSFRAIISVLYWVSLSSISWAQISWLHQRNAGWDFRGTWPSRRQPVPNCCRKNSASDWLMRMATRPLAFRTPSTDAASRCSSGLTRSALPNLRPKGASHRTASTSRPFRSSGRSESPRIKKTCRAKSSFMKLDAIGRSDPDLRRCK